MLFLPVCSVPTCFSRLTLRASTSLWSSILCWTLASTLGTASNWKIKAEYVDKKQTSAQLFSRQADHTSAVSQLCHWLRSVEWKDYNNLVRNYPPLDQMEPPHINHHIKGRRKYINSIYQRFPEVSLTVTDPVTLNTLTETHEILMSSGPGAAPSVIRGLWSTP